LIILGIESATENASCALLSDTKLLGEYSLNTGKTHSENLMNIIDKLIVETEVELRDISGIAITKGPGSYTGLRIGISIAKSMSQTLKIPILSVSTLESLAYNLPCSENIINPILDARSNRIYTGIYRLTNNKIEESEKDSATNIEEHINFLKKQDYDKKIIFIGDGAVKHKELLKTEFKDKCTIAENYINIIKASSSAQAGLIKFKNKDLCSWRDFNPVYLRKTQAERNKK